MMHHIKWMHLQDRTKGKVRITNIVSHGYDAVSIRASVLVHRCGEKVKLLLDCAPGLLALGTGQLRVIDRSGTGVAEVSLATLGETLVAEGDEDREAGFGEDVLKVVDEEGLESPGALWIDGASRVAGF